MKVARFIEPGNIEICEEPIPLPKSGEIVVKVKNSGICGTDHHIFTGKVKGLVDSGIILGHEFSGEVYTIGENVIGFSEEDPVAIEPNLYCGSCHYCRNAKKHFCENWSAIGISRDGGFGEYVSIPASAAYHLPKGLDFKKAAFFEPMACVLHGIERGRVKVGDNVLIQGAGSIGQLFTQSLKNLGVANIFISDIDSQKLKLAKQFGADYTINVKETNLSEFIKEETNHRGVQVIIDAAGLTSTIPTALDMLENTGRVVIFGVPNEIKNVEIRPYEIYRREIEIIGSFTNPYTNEASLEMLKKIETDPIITNQIKLDNLVQYGLNILGKSGVLKIQVQF